jgi:hypothetical protein
VLRDALLPAERELVELGEEAKVRDSRLAYQVATADEFIATVEQIVKRKVASFASAIDPRGNIVFENFALAPDPAGPAGGDGAAPPDTAPPNGREG